MRALIVVLLVATAVVGCARTGVGVSPNSAMVRGSIPLN